MILKVDDLAFGDTVVSEIQKPILASIEVEYIYGRRCVKSHLPFQTSHVKTKTASFRHLDNTNLIYRKVFGAYRQDTVPFIIDPDDLGI